MKEKSVKRRMRKNAKKYRKEFPEISEMQCLIAATMAEYMRWLKDSTEQFDKMIKEMSDNIDN